MLLPILITIMLIPYAIVFFYQRQREKLFAELIRAYSIETAAELSFPIVNSIPVRTVRGQIKGSNFVISDCYNPTWLRPKLLGTPPLFLRYFAFPLSFAGAETKIFVNEKQFNPGKSKSSLLGFLSRAEIYSFLYDLEKHQTIPE